MAAIATANAMRAVRVAPQATRPHVKPVVFAAPRVSSVAARFANDKAVDSLIKKDHAKVEALFKQYNKTPEGEDKLRIAHEVIRELSVHAAKEETVVYPEIAKREGQEVADHAREEHQSLKELLAKLDGMGGWKPEVEDLMQQVIKETRSHVKEEEGDILPRLAADVGPEKMAKLGEQFEAAKIAAPTRPHPLAPNSPPLNGPLNAATVPIDLVRDAARYGVEETAKYVQGKVE